MSLFEKFRLVLIISIFGSKRLCTMPLECLHIIFSLIFEIRIIFYISKESKKIVLFKRMQSVRLGKKSRAVGTDKFPRIRTGKALD